jgi:predicted RNA-binding Zn ribbon-like protein
MLVGQHVQRHALPEKTVTDAVLSAPGELELVRAFVNTRDLELGTDELSSSAALAAWLSERGLVVPATAATDADLRRALALREGLRGLLLANAAGTPPDADAADAVDAVGRRCALRARAGGEGPPLVAAGRGADAGLGRLLAIVVLAQADGTWLRLKACPGERCQWALYDRTRSRTRTWCAAAKCGARARSRAYRRRHSG